MNTPDETDEREPKPIKVPPAMTLPDDPAVQAFYARMKGTRPFRISALTPKQRNLLWTAYMAGWNDHEKSIETTETEAAE